MTEPNIFNVTQDTFLSYSLEKQLELFHLYLSNSNLYNGHKNNIYHFYSNHPYFKNTENTLPIFEKYIQLPEDGKMLNPKQANIIKLFFNISDPTWIYYKTEKLSLFLQNAFDYYEEYYMLDKVQPFREIKQRHGEVLKLVKNSILSLEIEEFELFLVQMKQKYSAGEQELLYRLITPHLSSKQQNSMESLVFPSISEDSKHTIYWDYFCSSHVKNLYQKAPQIIETLNSISQQRNILSLADELGRYMDSDKLKFYLHYYEQLPESFKQPFFEKTLYQSLVHYNNNFSSIVESILDNINEHQDKISKDSLIFILWRTIHVVPKDEKNRLFDLIYGYIKKENLQTWLHDKLYHNTELSFGGNTVNLNNVTVQDFLKKKLYNVLNIDLNEKEVKTRHKI